MPIKFLNALRKQNNLTTTENGAIALKSTQSALLDLFGQVGALRPRSEDEIEKLFIQAFQEDSLLATKIAFYSRDIRFGGLGERRTFRVLLKFLGNLYPEMIQRNLQNIPWFGRFDDLLELMGTKSERAMLEFIREQWDADLKNMKDNQSISLMAKWLPSMNASSEKTKKMGAVVCKALELSPKAYRKTLTALRGYLDLVEIKMSDNNWKDITYSTVPSKAMNTYRNAYKRHDQEGFAEYLESLAKGETKINAVTLFPYDIILKMISGAQRIKEFDAVLEAQWKALPNYVTGENELLIMADTSGSMFSSGGRPYATAVGLAIYFAERNQGAFKNTFMTFSEKPELVTLHGNTLHEKLSCVKSIVANTNLEAALQMILHTAVKNKLKQSDLPKSLIIISDMQFDQATSCPGEMTFYETMGKRYIQNGFKIPNIVFWNVESRQDSFQITSKYKGVQLASGQSPSVFKAIIQNLELTPYEAMLKVLNNPAYDQIA